jgi:glutaredoxin
LGVVRAIVFLAVAALLVLGAGRVVPSLVARQAGEPAPAALAGEDEAGPQSNLGEAPGGAERAPRSDEPSAPVARTYYRYLDAEGSLHYVDALERVPEAFRASARPLSMGAGSGDEAPRLTRAETSPTPHRPFAGFAVPQQPPARRARASAEVVVYSTSWCPWCRKTMAWLDEHGVEYENRDIEKNPAFRAELREKSGGTSIPVVEIDGQLIRGFNPGRMGRLL